MEILTEEIHPRERGSKVWSEVLCQIESGQIKTLVVPRLSHIIGNDFIGLSKFLSYLRSKGAKLRSIQEFIDSDRESHQDIVTNFYLEVTGKKVIGGGQ
jgi:DNA invertase Pin-like site-specific DNA recombinase